MVRWIIDSLEEDRIWSVGRVWVGRLIVWVFMGYLLIRYLVNPGYADLVFKNADFIIHEAGHAVFGLVGSEFLGMAGGTILQLIISLLAWVNFIKIKDRFATKLSLFWLGINCLDVGTYAGDAQKQVLDLVPLFGPDPIHDWNYLLSIMGIVKYDWLVGDVFYLIGYGLMIGLFGSISLMLWWMVGNSKS